MEQAGGTRNVVTGAFSFSGSYIAARLLAMGEGVRTLTNHPRGDASIEAAPLDFRNAEELTRNLAGAEVLYNTYWVRFAQGAANHEKAVENTKALIHAAEQAGVKRIVHISVANPSSDSPLPYFKGKAAVEELIRSSSLSYAILRPAVVFGAEDILINNIAWLLRRFPVFAIPRTGNYGLQPIFVEDLAALAVEAGHGRANLVMDAVGPETYEYEDLVRLIRSTVGSQSRIVHTSPFFVGLASWFLGKLVHDVVLTKDEVSGLIANLLVSKELPTGQTSLRAWLQDNAGRIGAEYASELKRHYR
ncbi:MAG: NAD(P)H-binding protein [Terriglobales bacterium]